MADSTPTEEPTPVPTEPAPVETEEPAAPEEPVVEPVETVEPEAEEGEEPVEVRTPVSAVSSASLIKGTSDELEGLIDAEEVTPIPTPVPEPKVVVEEMVEAQSPAVSPELETLVAAKEVPKPVEEPSSSLKDWSIALAAVALGVTIIILSANFGSGDVTVEYETEISSLVSSVPNNKFPDVQTIFEKGGNKCYMKNPKFANTDCVHLPGPQAGANVTKGYVGEMEVDVVPNTAMYWQSSMCPVNVHWHLGTEHYSVGEYDEDGDGPHGNLPAPKRHLAAVGEEVRAGYRCHHYDAEDEKFTKEYDWKHCIGMEVGETYEVHWPHSAAGACGTVDQYQTPFYDGVFCNLDDEAIAGLKPQDIANAVGVQAQIFTVVNDEKYFYPDLIRSWIVDGEYGEDIHYYTGSTTGTSRDNKICSSYTPITWQVDRKCHMISASSFDKLCYDMKLQRDDMSKDLHAHGSRELVASKYVANNQQRNRQLHEHDHHHHAHSHDDHDHDHHEWF